MPCGNLLEPFKAKVLAKALIDCHSLKSVFSPKKVQNTVFKPFPADIHMTALMRLTKY
jgi:hypothetical protein